MILAMLGNELGKQKRMRADRIVAAIAAALPIGLFVALLTSGIGATQRTKAQGGYPDRPVTLIVPYAPRCRHAAIG
jgi:hypothetical protein